VEGPPVSLIFTLFSARKHFELGAQQDLFPLLSDEGLAMANSNMDHLISSLGKQVWPWPAVIWII
jgi:hypothetical protein